MQILIISKRRGTAGGVRLSWFGVSLAALLGVAVASGAALWSYTRGGDDMLDTMLNDPQRSATLWQREILMQRQFLNHLHRDLEADLSALSGSVGRMQGALARLDAVAENVATTAGLDAAEFAFGQPAPVGGPQPAHSEAPSWDELLANLGALGDEIRLRESRLDSLEAILLERRQIDDARALGRPVYDGWVSSGYGYRTDPVTGRREFHSGIDIAGKPGLEVRSAAAGVVIWSDQRWGYGNLVEISHGQGYVTRYAHNRVNLVRVGEKVDRNQPIAVLGASGRATGPHVHFEVVHHDQAVDPLKFIERHARR